ncbi:MAG: cytochrome b/b6 domain-containing protein [Acidobacteriota bacterium]
MELFQWELNPWGQEILVRISWDLFWAAAAAGFLFIVGHLLYRRWAAKRVAEAPPAPARSPGQARNIPQRVVRHPLASRLFHGVMAASMFVLLFTGFLPVLGIKFSWVAIHWISGLVLTGSIVFHIVHASFWEKLENIWISLSDMKEWWNEMKQIAGRPGPPRPKPGKYPVENKLFHHLVVLAGFGVIATGLFMMVRVETPFWTRDPYLLSEATWGLVYVFHGLSSVALVTLIMAHVYFAILPEKRWLTLSMVVGWITRKDYVENHDPARWVIQQETPAESTQPQRPQRLGQEPT